MNNIHKSVWNEAVGAWVAVSELSKAKRKGSAKRGRAAAVVLGAGAVSFAPAAFAGSIVNCAGDGTVAASSQWVDAATGKAFDGGDWGRATGSLGGANCGGGSGVIIEEENSGNNDVNGSTAYIMVGRLASSDAGSVTIYGPAGITLGGPTTTTGVATFQAGADMSGTGIANLADGTSDKDAVNLGQLNQRTRYFHANSLQEVPESDARAIGGDSIAAGPWALASGTNSAAVGRGASAPGTDSVALGANAKAMSAEAIAIGAGASTISAGSVALGAGSIANRANAVSVGTATSQRQIINVAEGTAGTDAVNLNQLNAAIERVPGGGSPDAVVYDTSAHDKVTFGGAGASTPVTLTNLAAGQVASGSRDAINGSQLYNTASSVADALGGASTVGADGRVTRPAYTLDGSTYDDVGAALTAVNAKAGTGSADGVQYDTSAHDKVTFGGSDTAAPVTLSNVAAGKAGTDAVNVNQLKAMGASMDDNGNATNAFVAYDDASKSTITLQGASGTKITGLSAGILSAASTEAVNGSQLYETNQNLTDVAGDVTSLTNTVNNLTNGGAGVKYFHASSTLEDSSATGTDSIAIGGNASATADRAIALGANASANMSNAVALGAGSVADRADSISVGSATLQRQIVNVAAGTADYDAVNVTQLKGVTAALGGGADVDSDGTIKAPSYRIGGKTYTDLGSALDAASAGSSPDAVLYDTAEHDRLTLGGGASGEVVLTNVADATGDTDAVNLRQLKAAGLTVDPVTGASTNVFVAYDDLSKGAVTFNMGGTPTQLKNVAAGTDAFDAVNLSQMESYVATYAGGSNGGNGGAGRNAVQYDDASQNAVTLGGAGHAPVKLSNVADGTDANDAVNFSQFSSLQSAVDNIAAGTGNTYISIGGSSDPAGGTPASAGGTDSIAIGNGASAPGAAAIAIGAGTSTSGDHSVALGAGSSAPASNSVALGANSVADRDNSVSVGTAGAERQITNVAAGTAPTDAVNVGQMNGAISGVYQSMHDMDRDFRRGIASSAALNIVTPYLPGRTTLNAGAAGYRGQAAIGIGVSRWNEKGTVNYNLGLSSAGGNSTIVRAGLGIVLGS